MAKVIQLITKALPKQVSTLPSGERAMGNSLIIKAQAGVKYELKDAATKFAPQQLLLLRKGRDLWIKLNDEEEDALNATDIPDIIIENYYDDSPGSLIGMSKDGQYYNYAPQEGISDLFSVNMDDGEFSYQSLGYSDIIGESNWAPFMLGALLLGGLAYVLNDDDNTPDTPDTPDRPDMTATTDTGSSNTDDYTGDNTPDFAITPPANGQTPNLYIDGEIVPSTFDPINNILTPINPILDGPHTITITITDSNGESPQSPELYITIDTTPPLAPTVEITKDTNNDGYINAAELSGNVDVRVTLPAGTVAGDTLNVTDGTTPQTFILTATDIANGYIDTSFASPGEGNTITVSAIVTDIAGNTSPSGSDSAIIDTTADNDGDGNTVTIESITVDSGVAGDFITNDTNILIHGTVDLDDGNTLSVSFNGTTYTAGVDPELTVDGGGNWTLDATSTTLSDGTYPVVATVTDIAGNTSTDNVPVTIDTTPPLAPTVEITEDTNNDGYINAAELSGNVDVRVTLPAGTVAGDTLNVTDGTTPQTFILTATDIANGYIDTSFASPGEGNTITVSAIVTDIAGNTSPSGSDSAIIDTTADNDGDGNTVTIESITVDSGVAGDFITNDTNILIHGTVDLDDGNTLSVSFNGTTYTAGVDPELTVDGGGNWTLDATSTTLSDGTYPVVATVTDIAGNTSTDNVPVTIDTTPPALLITIDDITSDNIINVTEAGGNVAVTGTVAGEFSAGDTVTLIVNGNTFTGTVDIAGAFSIDIPGSDLVADGDLTVDASVSHTDTAGNIGTRIDTKTYTVDITATITNTTPIEGDDIINASEDNDVVISGTTTGVEAGRTVTVVIS
ncbi:MAG: Ig-like domain-containing protein, partial [Sulfurovaceae bacterium]